MELILGSRQSGKTTRLIQLCREDGGYIVCATTREAHRIFLASGEDDRKTIPFPITFDEFLRSGYCAKGVKSLLIDDADLLLQQISKVPIRAVSMTNE